MCDGRMNQHDGLAINWADVASGRSSADLPRVQLGNKIGVFSRDQQGSVIVYLVYFLTIFHTHYRP